MFIVRGILDSLSGIPNSKAQDSNSRRKFFPESGFHKNKLLGFRSPDFLTWSEPMVILECCVLSAFLMKAFPTTYSVSEDYYHPATKTTGTCQRAAKVKRLSYNSDGGKLSFFKFS